MAPDVADRARDARGAWYSQPVGFLDVAHRQPPAAPDRVEPPGEVRGQPRHVLAVVHAGRLEEHDVLEPPSCCSRARSARRRRTSAAATSRTANGSVPTNAASSGVAVSQNTVTSIGRSADPAAHHLEQRLRELVGAARVVQHHGHAAALPPAAAALERRTGPSTFSASCRPERPPRTGRRAPAADPAACRGGRAARTRPSA